MGSSSAQRSLLILLGLILVVLVLVVVFAPEEAEGQSASPSKTRTRTKTKTKSRTKSISRTRTRTPSKKTPTRTRTKSNTRTKSKTRTRTRTRSKTSPSRTRTRTSTKTRTRSPSRSRAPVLPSRVVIPRNFTWAQLAWGWEDGGTDTTTGMKVVEVDIDTTPSQITNLRNAGHIVVCYFSGGTIEPWRPDCAANKTAWEAIAVGNMADWDEAWLDIRQLTALQNLMKPRYTKAKQLGCHAVEPDNVDCYGNEDCWGQMKNPTVSSGDQVKNAQITYNKWMAQYAHSLGLSIALKNSVGLISTLHTYYDFAINEQCGTYTECSSYAPFTNANKAVLAVEYTNHANWCTVASTNKLQTKYCTGSNSEGICTSGAWINCFQPVTPLPATTYTTASP